MGASPGTTLLIPMIGYWRVSYGREEMLSPDLQEKEIRQWAGRNGRRVVRWVGDPDNTGRNFNRRVQEAIAAIEAGEAAEIGVYNYKRWGRNTLESLLNIQRVEDAGGDVISVSEYTGGTDSSFGRAIRRELLSRAEQESDFIGEGWRQAHASRVDRGLPATGTPRFGYVRRGRIKDEDGKYRRDPDDPLGERYEPDPETGPIYAQMYRRDTGGEPRRAIVRWLNSNGIVTAAGGPWTIPGVRNVLESGFGAGLLRIHDPDCRIKPTREKQCNRTIYVPGAHEPVLEPGEWEAWLDRKEQRAGTPPRLRDPVHPFSGLLWCGDRDHRLRSGTSRAGALFYHCALRGEARGCPGAYVREDAVEEYVLEWLSQWAADIEAAARAETARRRTVTRAQHQGEQLAKREAVLQRKLARLMARWAADESMEPEAYEMARKPLTGDLEAVRAAMRDAEGARKANVGEFVPVAAGLLETWPLLPPSRKRELLASMIARVEVHRTGARKPARLVIVPVWEAGE